MIAIWVALSLASAATAAQSSAPSKSAGADEADTYPPFVTAPTWLRKPTPIQLKALFPVAALRAGKEGRAVLKCRVDVSGILEDCRTKSEDPPGLGFGDAALALTPQFLFNPAKDAAGRPVPSLINLPIAWYGMAGTVVRSRGYAMVPHPVWTAAPRFADLAAAYPLAGGGLEGKVTFECKIDRSPGQAGELEDCAVVLLQPADHGFAAAAKPLLRKFREDVSTLPDDKREYHVAVPIHLLPPQSPQMVERRVGQPFWQVVVDPNRVAAVYPAAAAAKGVRTGRGVAHCEVAVDGSLHDCVSGPSDPTGLGFSEAAVRVAEVMKMTRWTEAGGPVDGVVDLPIRFVQAEPTAAAARDRPPAQ